MEASPEDTVYLLLMRSLVPLVEVSPGLPPGKEMRICGIARTATGETARVFLAGTDSVNSGFALEITLSDQSGPIDVSAAVRYVTYLTTTAAIYPDATSSRDTHGNYIIPGIPSDQAAATHPGEGMFRTLNLMLGSGNPFAFDDAYELVGFLYRADQRCRIYIRTLQDDVVYGVDFLLIDSSGIPHAGIGASLPQELAALSRTGDLALQPKIDSVDEYCDTVIDMSAWVNPPPLDPAKSRSRHRPNSRAFHDKS